MNIMRSRVACNFTRVAAETRIRPRSSGSALHKKVRRIKPLMRCTALTVGGDEGARVLVAARDELEKQVGVAVGVGEVADLIDDEEAWAGVVAKPPAQCGIAVERGEIAEHVAGGGKQHGMAGGDGLVSDILGD